MGRCTRVLVATAAARRELGLAVPLKRVLKREAAEQRSRCAVVEEGHGAVIQRFRVNHANH